MPVVTTTAAVLRPANSVYAVTISTFSVYLKAAGYLGFTFIGRHWNGAAANAF
jgi:hypothetical protein